MRVLWALLFTCHIQTLQATIMEHINNPWIAKIAPLPNDRPGIQTKILEVGKFGELYLTFEASWPQNSELPELAIGLGLTSTH